MGTEYSITTLRTLIYIATILHLGRIPEAHLVYYEGTTDIISCISRQILERTRTSVPKSVWLPMACLVVFNVGLLCVIVASLPLNSSKRWRVPAGSPG